MFSVIELGVWTQLIWMWTTLTFFMRRIIHPVTFYVPVDLPQDFSTAARLLKAHKSQIQAREGISASGVVQQFFEDLASLEERLNRHPIGGVRPILIEIEGLDGTGKSTLSKSLAERLGGRRMSTPCESLRAIRHIFDSEFEGPISRAFYFVSNYFLADEIQRATDRCCIVIDRWYASTCAYSAGENVTGDVLAIDALNDVRFAWPKDLLKPDIILLLKIDETTRKLRVSERNVLRDVTDDKWDNLLQQDIALSKRIQRAFERTDDSIPKAIISITASDSENEVVEQSYRAVHHLCPCASIGETISKVTLVIFGTHCSGKSTVSLKTARCLGWVFNAELGDVLRDRRKAAQPDGHRFDDDGDTWDGLIHKAEVDRDSSSNENRVVETWHIGNNAWAEYRAEANGADKDILCARATKAIEAERQRGRHVLLVHLKVDGETTERRRIGRRADLVLPFKDEKAEAARLQCALGDRSLEIARQFHEHDGIPLLELENNIDGAKAIGDSLVQIINFVKDHTKYIVLRTLVPPSFCDSIVSSYHQSELQELTQETIPDHYKWGSSNTVYQSSSNKVLTSFLKTDNVLLCSDVILSLLSAKTNFDWKRDCVDSYVPCFKYPDGGFMRLHKDHDISKRRKVNALMMCTEPGLDYSGGDFILNTHAAAGDDGKLLSEDPSKRMLFTLHKGDVCVFHNSVLVHGVETVHVIGSQTGRLTASWRL